METSQLIFSANQLSGFYILKTLLLNVLRGQKDLLGNFAYFYFAFFVIGYNCVIIEAYLEPSRTARMELFAKIVNG